MKNVSDTLRQMEVVRDAPKSYAQLLKSFLSTGGFRVGLHGHLIRTIEGLETVPKPVSNNTARKKTRLLKNFCFLKFFLKKNK